MTNLSNEQLLQRLVAFDSTSSNSNLEIAGFIADYLDRPGTAVRFVDSEDGAKRNLIAVVGPQADADHSRGLVLSGHMDVVPALEPAWHSDPFSLTDRGDRWVARGSADMKGFLALAINAVAAAAATRMARPLALVLTYDEEVGCLGAKRLVDVWPSDLRLPRNAIIGEPTALRVVRMNKGHLKLLLTVRGKSAHSGYPHLGVNAIERAGRVLGSLDALRRELEAERPENSRYFASVPFVPLNIGTIRGGTAINIVPDFCELEIGVRLLPGMDTAAAVDRIRHAVESTLSADQFSLVTMSNSPPMLLAEDREICRKLTGMIGQPGTESVSFATDGGWLQSLGFESVLFGPGSIEVAHRANEYLPKGEFNRAAELLDEAITIFCRNVVARPTRG